MYVMYTHTCMPRVGRKPAERRHLDGLEAGGDLLRMILEAVGWRTADRGSTIVRLRLRVPTTVVRLRLC